MTFPYRVDARNDEERQQLRTARSELMGLARSMLLLVPAHKCPKCGEPMVPASVRFDVLDDGARLYHRCEMCGVSSMDKEWSP